MIDVFLSCSFSPKDKTIVETVKALCHARELACVNVSLASPHPPATEAKRLIANAAGLVAIATRRSALARGGHEMPTAVREEITIAHTLGKPVLLLIEDGVVVDGFLPSYATHVKFARAAVLRPPTLETLAASINRFGDHLVAPEAPALAKPPLAGSRSKPVIHLGAKSGAGRYMDQLILGAKRRIDVLALSFNDFFSGRVTPKALVRKVASGCEVRLLALDPESEIVDLRARDEGLTGDDLRATCYARAQGHWVELSRRLAEGDRERMSGRLDVVWYSSLPYFSLLRADDALVFALYNRNAACRTSASFLIDAGHPLMREFEQDFDFLVGSQLVTRRPIRFRGAPAVFFASEFELSPNVTT